MDADLFGNVLDHHGAQRIHAALQKLGLPPHDGLAGAQDGAFALLDVTNQLQRRAVAFLYVLLDLALGIAL